MRALGKLESDPNRHHRAGVDPLICGFEVHDLARRALLRGKRPRVGVQGSISILQRHVDSCFRMAGCVLVEQTADHVDWRAHLALFDPFRISTGFSWLCCKPSNSGAGQCLGLVFKIIGAWSTWQLGTSIGPSSSGAARRKTGLLRPSA